MQMLERFTEITPAYDERHSNQALNHGIHGCDLKMVLKGKEGAVAFSIFTGWQLPGVGDTEAIGGYLDIHRESPGYEGHTGVNNCAYLPGRLCYMTSSSLQSNTLFELLRREGSESVWSEMARIYKENLQ